MDALLILFWSKATVLIAVVNVIYGCLVVDRGSTSSCLGSEFWCSLNDWSLWTTWSNVGDCAVSRWQYEALLLYMICKRVLSAISSTLSAWTLLTQLTCTILSSSNGHQDIIIICQIYEQWERNADSFPYWPYQEFSILFDHKSYAKQQYLHVVTTSCREN